VETTRRVELYWLTHGNPCKSPLFKDSDGIRAMVREDISTLLQGFDSSGLRNALAEITSSHVE
jgi:hypothetical protein